MEASIVIPTYNKAAYLEFTLQSLFYQSCEKSRFEIVVVVGECTDMTSKVIEHFASLDWDFSCVRQQNPGLSAARNAGLRAARGPIIISIDDDCICEKNFISRHIAKHDETRNKVVIGPRREVFTRIPFDQELFFNVMKGKMYEMNWIATENTKEKVCAALPPTYDIISLTDVTDNQKKIDLLSELIHNDPRYLQMIAEAKCSCPWHFFFTTNASFRRDLLFAVDLFDEEFQGWGEEDIELGYRLYCAGAEFDAELDALVYHQIHPLNWSIQSKAQFRNYVRFAEKHKVPEIYLRWQVLYNVISVDQYEATVSKIKVGHLNGRELHAIKEQYDQLVKNNGDHRKK
jgi:glycosyltransferase involved in cell wall biosynthesis